MSVSFEYVEVPSSVSKEDWQDWKWHMRHSLKSESDFDSAFHLNSDEKEAIQKGHRDFAIRTTPYYAELCKKYSSLRKMIIPSMKEFSGFYQEDPLGETQNSPTPRIIHRYPDRVLFLVTDFCGIYCRYCTRKYFTSQGHSVVSSDDYKKALEYIRNNKGIREVILSGGDPLTLSDQKLKKILQDIRSISHIEIIRIGTRMLTVCPFRVTPQFIEILSKNQPVFLMTHFNHPKELTHDVKQSLSALCDRGIPIYNQMVLLNGINNHPALVQALSRRLLYIRVRPYYMFQCDPSPGTDHLRTSIENSKWIQEQLWGTLSGLAVPRLSMDLPDGGGKVELVPNHFIKKQDQTYIHKGFDGVQAGYPSPRKCILPEEKDMEDYLKEWEVICQQSYGQQTSLKKEKIS